MEHCGVIELKNPPSLAGFRLAVWLYGLFLAPEFRIEFPLSDKPLPLPKCPIVLFPHLEQIDNRVIDSGSEFFRSVDVDWLEGYNAGILQGYKLSFDDFKCLVDTGEGLVNRLLVLSKWLSGFRLFISHAAPPMCGLVRAAFRLIHGRCPFTL